MTGPQTPDDRISAQFNEGEAAPELERLVVRVIQTVLLRLWAGLFIVGVASLVSGEIIASNTSNTTLTLAAVWLSRIGLALGAAALPLGLISWFERETTKHDSFAEQRLPRQYRVLAWSAVAVALVLFGIVLWYTLSRGLTTW